MAKLTTGYMGAFSGKLGTAVGFSWKGRVCVRSYCRHIHDARTPLQLEQRSRFTAMIRFAQQSVHALRLGFKPLGDKLQITEGNCFTKRNTDRFRMVGGELRVDYEHLVLSEGSLEGVLFSSPQFDADSGVSIEYEGNTTAKHASPSDAVYVYAYCPEAGEGRLLPAAKRGDAHIGRDLPYTWRGLAVHLYGFTIGRHGDVSPTQYIGQGTVGTPVLQVGIGQQAVPEHIDNQQKTKDSTMSGEAVDVTGQLSLWDLLADTCGTINPPPE